MLHKTDDQPTPAYKRVLLKISGEALMGDQGFGLHPPTVERIAQEVKAVHDMGVEICMVIGGGNVFRGLQGSAGKVVLHLFLEATFVNLRHDVMQLVVGPSA